jgi:myo-inositol-1-phosphate synthase
MANVGVWLIGAQGSLAATVVLGARAVARRLVAGAGLVTESPALAPLPLVGLRDLVFGGWDIAPSGLVARARALARDDGAVSEALVTRLEADLKTVEARVKPGFAAGGGPANRPSRRADFVPRTESLAAAVERLGDDLDGFRREHDLETVIVVNLAATEPSCELTRDHPRLDRFRRAIEQHRAGLVTPSMLYAYAALERGFPYLNFTPSVGVAVPALQELAAKHHVPCYGRDGKTGETLVKTVLAPIFRARNLEVLSWAGFHILGGGDGRVLAEPLPKRSKLRSKAGVLGQALGTSPTSPWASSTCRRSGTGRPPGTSSTSGASSARR